MKQAPWIIISVLLAIVLIQQCNKPEPPTPEVKEIVIHDTIIIPGDSVPVPYPVVKIRDQWHIIYDTIIREVDTAAILADYFAHRYGIDTLANDTNTFVSIRWYVHQNRLINVWPYIMNRKPSTIIYQTTIQEIEKPKNRYFAGIGLGRSPDEFGLTGSVALLNKKNNLYSLSYDVLHKDIYFTLYWRIR